MNDDASRGDARSETTRDASVDSKGNATGIEPSESSTTGATRAESEGGSGADDTSAQPMTPVTTRSTSQSTTVTTRSTSKRSSRSLNR